MTTHSKAQHGGWQTQARRRGEEFVACSTCGQPSQWQGSRYASEVSDRAIEQARRKVARRDQATPEQPEEHWGPVKIGVVVVFAIGFIYAIVIIGAGVAA